MAVAYLNIDERLIRPEVPGRSANSGAEAFTARGLETASLRRSIFDVVPAAGLSIVGLAHGQLRDLSAPHVESEMGLEISHLSE